MPIDINLLREDKGGDPEEFRESERRRGKDPALVDRVLNCDTVWRSAVYKLDKLREAIGVVQRQITVKKKSSRGQDPCEEELTQKRGLEQQEEDQKRQVLELQTERDTQLKRIGNLVADDVVTSQDEADNAVVRRWGTPHAWKVDGKTYGRLHHHQILHMIGGYDSRRGVEVGGHRAYFLRGVGVLLNMALVNYGLAFLIKKNYTALQPPYFMKKDVMAETAELHDFDEQLYKVSETNSQHTDKPRDYYLIATAEQPISAYHRREWLEPSSLPLRYAGFSSCFRKEAGSHGKDVWGLFRVHQFEKVEQFCIVGPEESEEMHEEMIQTAEEFYKSLGLPYQVISIVSGALNDAAAKKYDLEAWFPGYDRYRELVSVSNCTDYQSRAMETRCGMKKLGDREKRYVHMLNGTLCATERTLCCILENYQTEKGVVVPEVLRPYMMGMEFIEYTKPLLPLNTAE